MIPAFVITKKQMDYFNNSHLHNFYSDLADYFREGYPTEYATQTEEHWLEWIRTKTREAQHYQIFKGDEIAYYIELNFIHPDLDKNPKPNWAEDILTWPSRQPQKKLNLIDEHYQND